MKKYLIIGLSAVAAIIAGIIVYIVLFSGNQDIQKDNDAAEKEKENRYLTVINETGQIINEVYVLVGEGTEIETMKIINPDKESFSVEIPNQYDEYTSFKVVFIDRYGLKYEKTADDVPVKGRTEVKITEDNYVSQRGDIWKKVDKFFNNF